MDTPERIQKLIAAAGICSRREAERLIEDGRVRVNGKIAQLGDKALISDAIFVNNKPMLRQPEAPVTLVMNKPKGLICSNDDPFNARTVFDLLPPPYSKMRMFCAGRLDKDSEGLLVLTNDGALAHRLTHPGAGVIKRYRVLLNKPFNTADIPKLLEGVEDDGELLKAEKVIPAPAGGADAAQRVEVHLCHGKKREIRRLFEANRYFVKKLVRFQIGGIILKGLPRGGVRRLSNKDIERLCMGAR
jgi:23S rRNA pseudouridine2605 synthase